MPPVKKKQQNNLASIFNLGAQLEKSWFMILFHNFIGM